MEGSTCRKQSALKLARCFECSRLEKQLLASAYEHVLPVLSRRLSGNQRVERFDSEARTKSKQCIAIGG